MLQAIVLSLILNRVLGTCTCDLNGVWKDGYRIDLKVKHNVEAGTFLVKNSKSSHWQTATGKLSTISCVDAGHTCCHSIELEVLGSKFRGELGDCNVMKWPDIAEKWIKSDIKNAPPIKVRTPAPITKTPTTETPTEVPAPTTETEAPSTPIPPTPIPSTETPTEVPSPTTETGAPSTPIPSTEGPSTQVPAPTTETEAPSTLIPTTEAPATQVPAPTTETEAPSTPIPSTEGPSTQVPAPTTETEAPSTPIPSTESPSTEVPSPTTNEPHTEAPTTPIPSPATEVPETTPSAVPSPTPAPESPSTMPITNHWYDKATYTEISMSLSNTTVTMEERPCSSWCSAAGTLEAGHEQLEIRGLFPEGDRLGVLSEHLDSISWSDGTRWIAEPSISLWNLWIDVANSHTVTLNITGSSFVAASSTWGSTTGTISILSSGFQLEAVFGSQGLLSGSLTSDLRSIIWSNGGRWDSAQPTDEKQPLTEYQQVLKAYFNLSTEDMLYLISTSDVCAKQRPRYPECFVSRWSNWGACQPDPVAPWKERTRRIIWKPTSDAICPSLVDKEFCNPCAMKARVTVDISVDEMLYLMNA